MGKPCVIITVLLVVILVVLSLALVTWYFLPVEECDGSCVPMNKCRNLEWTVIDISTAGQVGRKCGHYLNVCCQPEFIVRNDSVLPKLENNTALTDFKQCGIRNEKGLRFSITHANGNEAQFAEFPWMVVIFAENSSLPKPVYRAGGSLISPGIVLTGFFTALKNRSTLIVRAGDWDTETESEALPFQERRVSRVFVHPSYSKSKKEENNLALLFLEKPFDPADNVQLICLPPQGIVISEQNCFAAGWGKLTFESKDFIKIMKKRRLPVVPHESCQKALRTTRLGSNFQLHESLLCAGGEKDHDTCRGDGGSPLVCLIPGEVGRYHQAGIVVGGIGCGEDGIPGLYTNISRFADWIKAEMRKEHSEHTIS